MVFMTTQDLQTAEITIADIKDDKLRMIVAAIAGGMTLKQACAKYEMAERTYNYNIARRPHILAQVHEANRTAFKELTNEIAERRIEVIKAILERAKGVDQMKSLQNMLNLETKLATLQVELEELEGIVRGGTGESNLAAAAVAGVTAAAHYLSNLPELKPAQGTYTEVIDGSISPSQEEEA